MTPGRAPPGRRLKKSFPGGTGFGAPIASRSGRIRIGTLYADTGYRFGAGIQEIPYTEAIARATLQRLVAAPELSSLLNEVGLTAVIPEETTIHGIAVDESGLARVTSTRNFWIIHPNRNVWFGSILCTLRQFPSIQVPF